jgi:hypothetical protein
MALNNVGMMLSFDEGVVHSGRLFTKALAK